MKHRFESDSVLFGELLEGCAVYSAIFLVVLLLGTLVWVMLR